jgi:hypothetical protein
MLELHRPKSAPCHRTTPVMSRPGTWPPHRRRRKGTKSDTAPATPKLSPTKHAANSVRSGPTR